MNSNMTLATELFAQCIIALGIVGMVAIALWVVAIARYCKGNRLK